MSLLAQLHILFLTPKAHNDAGLRPCLLPGGHQGRSGDSPDLEDLLRLFLSVRRGGDDEQAVQQVDGDAMRALIIGATDSTVKQERPFNINITANRVYKVVMNIEYGSELLTPPPRVALP